MYTLISYKPDSEDYCRGHRQASYTSDLDILCSEDPKEIAERWAELEGKEMRVGEQGYEFTLLIDGHEIYNFSDVESYEDEAEAKRFELFKSLRKLKAEAILRRQEEAEVRKEKTEKAAAEKKTQQEAEERARKESTERAEFERLKQKYQSQ